MTARLVLKRANASRSSGQWKDEDYDALTEGKIVGRILEEGSRFGPPELPWAWSITSIVAAIAGDARYRRDARRGEGEVRARTERRRGGRLSPGEVSIRNFAAIGSKRLWRASGPHLYTYLAACRQHQGKPQIARHLWRRVRRWSVHVPCS
jgi:hypothetical protein